MTMAHKGQLKTPVLPLKQAFDTAMDMIDSTDVPVALFMIAGSVHSTKSTSKSYENNLQRLASGLIGVYDQGADARGVLQDLSEFYPTKPVFDGVNIDRVHVLRKYAYGDPLEVLIHDEEGTCKGCVHKSKAWGSDFCDKPNGRKGAAVKRCKGYKDSE
jgi:hypothetical protein